MPEAIAVRERFITPDDDHRHLAVSALDPAWIDAVPEGRPVFITAQGLLMYFEEQAVRELLQLVAERVPGARLMFDCIPRWFSNKTLLPQGFKKTAHYRTPPMPFGLNKDEVKPTLRRWLPSLSHVELIDYTFPRGATRYLFAVMSRMPIISKHVPTVVRLRFGG